MLGRAMLDLFLLSFVLAFIGAGFRRPFIFVLAYTYIDIVAPQKVSWGILSHIPVSLIAFLCAFIAWFVAEDKNGIRVSLRQFLLLSLLVYCGLTTQTADFPVEAAEKWAWVWKALLFALFLPLTLRTRLRIEALTLIMVLSIGVIVIGGGIKTLAGGGGYGELRLLVDNNTGLYEGSIISAVAIAVIPLALWLSRFGTVFPPEWRVKGFAWALCFSCALMPIGTGARTGLVCVVVLAALILRTARRRALIVSLMVIGGLIAVPLLPKEFTDRMNTIGNHRPINPHPPAWRSGNGLSPLPNATPLAAGLKPIARTGWNTTPSRPTTQETTTPRWNTSPSWNRAAPIIRATSKCWANRAIRGWRCGWRCTCLAYGRWKCCADAIARKRRKSSAGYPLWPKPCSRRR